MSHAERRFDPAPRLMSEADFVNRFGGVYEHSTWIAQEAWRLGLNENHDSLDGLASAMARIVDQADRQKRVDLINAHPDLAGKAAIAGELTASSSAEQASAGIDQCNAEEFARFQDLNGRYKERFGMPFIMAVKGSNRHAILGAFEQRLEHSPQEEFDQAIGEIHKIAHLRLLELVSSKPSIVDSEQITVERSQQPNPFLQWVDLAQPRLGTQVVYATDDFFADKSRMIAPHEPVWVDDKYDDHGKWMDGWESRRKRTPGHDFAIVKLGVAGVLHGVDIDTAFFTGNFPPAASLEACVSPDDIPDENTDWQEIVTRLELRGDSHNFAEITAEQQFTHVRLHIFPDGGVARLRLYGAIQPDWSKINDEDVVDLVALTNGGKAIICNDEHFGSMRNLNAPGRGINMGDGWETARRREPGNDWVVLALGHTGVIERVLIDTAHFKGNYPDRVSIQAMNSSMTDPADIASASADWPHLVGSVKLEADAEHEFADDVIDLGPVTHVRINMFPDGGISRVRLLGRVFRSAK